MKKYRSKYYLGNICVREVFVIPFIVIAIILSIIPLLFNFRFISDDFFILHSILNEKSNYFGDWVNGAMQMFRPLISLSYFISYKIFYDNYFFYYAQNLVVHLANTYLVFQIIRKFSKKYTQELNSKRLSSVVTFLFFISPAAISNIYWIAGRTDIFVSFFGLIIVLVSLHIKEFIKQYFKYFFSTSIVLTLGFLSKETMLVFVFYSILLILFDKSELNIKQKLRFLLPIVIFTVIYFLVRLMMFSGNPIGKLTPNFELSANYLVKIIFYDLFSIISPIDIVDLISIYQSDLITQLIYSLLLSIPLLFFSYIFLRNFNWKRIKLALTLLTVLLFSTLIYFFNSYPQIRLMYAHIFIFYLMIVLLSEGASTIVRRNFLISFIILTIISSSLVLKSFIKVNEFTHQIAKRISLEEIVGDKYYLFLPNLGRIGQRWANPNIQIASYFWLNNSFTGKNENIHTVLYYETSSINTQFETHYSKLDSNKIIISVNNNFDGLTYAPAEKFKSLNDTTNLNQISVKIIPKEFQKNRFGLARSCEVHFTDELEKYMLFYYTNHGKLELISLEKFLDLLE